MLNYQKSKLHWCLIQQYHILLLPSIQLMITKIFLILSIDELILRLYIFLAYSLGTRLSLIVLLILFLHRFMVELLLEHVELRFDWWLGLFVGRCLETALAVFFVQLSLHIVLWNVLWRQVRFRNVWLGRLIGWVFIVGVLRQNVSMRVYIYTIKIVGYAFILPCILQRPPLSIITRMEVLQSILYHNIVAWMIQVIWILLHSLHFLAFFCLIHLLIIVITI